MNVGSLRAGDLIKFIRRNSVSGAESVSIGILIAITSDLKTPPETSDYIRVLMLDSQGRVLSSLCWIYRDEIVKIS